MARRWFDQDKLLEWIEDNCVVASRSGDEYVMDCPDCGSPKLWLNIDTGQCTCYRCEFGGSIYAVMEREGIERSEARRILGVDDAEHHERSDEADSIFPVVPVQTGVSSPPAEEFPQALPEGVKWYGVDSASCQAEAEMAGAALQAMYARGFPWEIIQANRAGWCWKGKYKERVILPVFKNGKVVWWQAWDYGKRFGDMKYKNPPNEDVPYGRKELIYNIERWTEVEEIAVVEGIFNAWALEQVGIAAVCTFGKLVSDEQFEQLLLMTRRPVKPVKKFWIGMDDDAIEKGAALHRRFSGVGCTSTLCRLPHKKDFNDLPPQERLAVLDAASAPDWLWEA